MARWLGWLESPETRSDVASPAQGRLDGDDSILRFQAWKLLTAVALAAGQTLWFVVHVSGGTRGVAGYAIATLAGVLVVFAGATWVARRYGLLQYERPWVAVPALVAGVVAIVSPLLVDDATGPFLATFLLLVLAGRAIGHLGD